MPPPQLCLLMFSNSSLLRASKYEKCKSHWGLWLSDGIGYLGGTLAHITVKKGLLPRFQTCRQPPTGQPATVPSRAEVQIEKFDPKNSCSLYTKCDIPGTAVDILMLTQAAHAVFKSQFSGTRAIGTKSNPAFNELTNNCQHWTYEVIRYMHREWPHLVTELAVDFIETERPSTWIKARQLINKIMDQGQLYERPKLIGPHRWTRSERHRTENGQWQLVEEYLDADEGFWRNSRTGQRVVPTS